MTSAHLDVYYTELIMNLVTMEMFFLLADGLALGAAAGLSRVDVELIIFLAIMLHKVS